MHGILSQDTCYTAFPCCAMLAASSAADSSSDSDGEFEVDLRVLKARNAPRGGWKAEARKRRQLAKRRAAEKENDAPESSDEEEEDDGSRLP